MSVAPIRLVENVLSQRMLDELYYFSRDGKPHYSNFTKWRNVVIGWSTAIQVFMIEGVFANVIKAELRPYVPPELFDNDWGISIHLGGPGSYIPWHNDSHQAFNITIYLNKIWERDHAGYFLYENGPEITAILPKYNLGLFYRSPILHSVALSTVNAPLRESLQAFISPTRGGGV